MSYVVMVIEKLQAIFGVGALEPRIASAIMAYVSEHGTSVRHINLAFVKQLCKLPNTEKVDVSVLKTLQALAGDAIGYLNVGFEYVDSNDEVHNISREAFAGAVYESIDPISGEHADDLSEKVLIYYFPDRTFPKRLLHK
jgi:hypothetical protein